MGRGDISVAPVPGLQYGKGRREGKSNMFSMIPLLVVSLILFTVGRFAGGEGWTDTEFFTLTMVSGDYWRVSMGHAFIILSMGFLFIELLRATKTGTDSLVNHALSALLFIATLLLFIIVPGYGNSIFFIFMSMTFLDFMAGFIVTTVTARRDFGVTG
ncbi:hypothetical protein [Parvularcula sp. LCG005]|uniref:hypothetical protein n=1 Tax=Parvularcula sp. LCG005 TaxID=3078805 RepID=UPI0029424FA1|nr:hypothetical protein [Parvularcula sp. LCG005]WOI52728.1 hypothetical protein RUI03_11285 [Parvularcula sp. LCG005]